MTWAGWLSDDPERGERGGRQQPLRQARGRVPDGGHQDEDQDKAGQGHVRKELGVGLPGLQRQDDAEQAAARVAHQHKRGERGEVVTNPAASFVLEAGDQLVLVGGSR